MYTCATSRAVTMQIIVTLQWNSSSRHFPGRRHSALWNSVTAKDPDVLRFSLFFNFECVKCNAEASVQRPDVLGATTNGRAASSLALRNAKANTAHSGRAPYILDSGCCGGCRHLQRKTCCFRWSRWVYDIHLPSVGRLVQMCLPRHLPERRSSIALLCCNTILRFPIYDAR